jgi:pimeloyl-ACP methyl ester carboxylesterase
VVRVYNIKAGKTEEHMVPFKDVLRKIAESGETSAFGAKPGANILKDFLVGIVSKRTNLSNEIGFVRDYLEFQMSSTYFGYGRIGNKKPVILVPGFTGGDWTLVDLHRWLDRMDYSPSFAGINFNIEYSGVLLDKLQRKLDDETDIWQRKAVLIGHSRGGMLSKLLSDRNPDKVEQVITLCSPLNSTFSFNQAVLAGLAIAAVYNIPKYGIRINEEFSLLNQLDKRSKVPLTSIRAKNDGVINKESCIRSDATNIEINSTHLGSLVNVDAYKAIFGALKRNAS